MLHTCRSLRRGACILRPFQQGGTAQGDEQTAIVAAAMQLQRLYSEMDEDDSGEISVQACITHARTHARTHPHTPRAPLAPHSPHQWKSRSPKGLILSRARRAGVVAGTVTLVDAGECTGEGARLEARGFAHAYVHAGVCLRGHSTNHRCRVTACTRVAPVVYRSPRRPPIAPVVCR